MSDWLADYLEWKAEHPETDAGDVFAGHFEFCYIREGALCSCGFQPPNAVTEK